MNKKSTNLFMFVAGAAVGSLATWMITKQYYFKIANDEIREAREFYYRRGEESEVVGEVEDVEESDDGVRFHITNVKPDLMEYAKRINENGYFNYSDPSKPAPAPKEVKNVEKPYVITPEEFGELGYSTVSLTYYQCGTITDEDGDILEDADDMIGCDPKDHFGEYEDDSVFLRDDSRRVDYEILADERTFVDAIKNDPHLAEDE